jgi:hypothetical protein
VLSVPTFLGWSNHAITVDCSDNLEHVPSTRAIPTHYESHRWINAIVEGSDGLEAVSTFFTMPRLMPWALAGTASDRSGGILWHRAREASNAALASRPARYLWNTVQLQDGGAGIRSSGFHGTYHAITYHAICWGLVLKCFELRTRQHKDVKC